MWPDLFKSLPSEITTDILSRLSVRSVAISKCVCKPWLHLLGTDDFIKSHSAKSSPALAFSLRMGRSNWFHLSELEDLDRRRHPLRMFDFSRVDGYAGGCLLLSGSANGFLLLKDIRSGVCTFYVCNPITREFCLLRCPHGNAFGFGVSRISGQYKVVSVDEQNGWYVHTLGTGSWRRLQAPDSFDSSLVKVAAFVQGNLHWMVTPDPHLVEWICCFDLETECFSRFTVPVRRNKMRRILYALRGSIGFCDESCEGGGFDLWMMKEYGDEKSWTKKYVIVRSNLDLNNDPILYDYFQCVCPVEVFENGDVLMSDGKRFMYYSNRAKTSREIGGLFDAGVEFYRMNSKTRHDFLGGLFDAGHEEFYHINSQLVTPTMVSLKSISGVEDVISF